MLTPLSEHSWGRCTPTVLCEQVQKRSGVSAVSSFPFSCLFFPLPSTRQIQPTQLWKLLNIFELTPVVTCCRSVLAHSINCSCVTWKQTAVWPPPAGDFSAQHWKLFVGSLHHSPRIWMVSCLLTNYAGCLTRAEMAGGVEWLAYYHKDCCIFRKKILLALHPAASLTVAPMIVVTIRNTWGKK